MFFETIMPTKQSIFGIEFPRELVGLFLIGIENLEAGSPGTGWKIGYHNPGMTGTIYIYDAGVENIPENLDHSIVITEFSNTCNDISIAKDRGIYTYVEPIGQPMLWGNTNKGISFLWAQFEVTYPDGRRRHTEAILTTWNGKFIKIRHSIPPSKFAPEAAMRFAKAVHSLTNKIKS